MLRRIFACLWVCILTLGTCPAYTQERPAKKVAPAPKRPAAKQAQRPKSKQTAHSNIKKEPAKKTAAAPKRAAPVSPLPRQVPQQNKVGSFPKAVTTQPAIPKVLQPPPISKEQVMSGPLVILDPGHGGYDLGARMSACDEKSLALSTALLTKKHLTDMGYRVVLTRSRDVFLPLEKRAIIANETKSKLFVSIHYNAARNPIAKGIEVFYYASADKFRTGSSKKLAIKVLSKVIDKTVAENRGVKEGNFYVIRETKMPAILIEAGFMTHPEELHRLKDVSYRDKIARGIAEGIDSFFKV